MNILKFFETDNIGKTIEQSNSILVTKVEQQLDLFQKNQDDVRVENNSNNERKKNLPITDQYEFEAIQHPEKTPGEENNIKNNDDEKKNDDIEDPDVSKSSCN